MPDTKEILCYNRGCGKTYDPTNNPNDGCRHHPGTPVFHDAYKGWSCCNKKCTDFTEFLNIPGCTVSQHSNEKPVESESPVVKEVVSNVVEIKPIVASTVERPPFDTPMVTVTPELAPSIKQQKLSTTPAATRPKTDDNIVTIGTTCKNGGCGKCYEGPDSDNETCVHHPGVPIFHEGLKFWSCCQKRTSDFNAFLNQVGCEQGKHLWFKKESNQETIECRWDWHQTGNLIVLTVYAKQYCPVKSTIQLNPIRVCVNLFFPLENNSFKLDLELCRVINIEQSTVTMFGTKVEINLRKAEAGSWSKLNIPMKKVVIESPKKENKDVQSLEPEFEAVDLNDL